MSGTKRKKKKKLKIGRLIGAGLAATIAAGAIGFGGVFAYVRFRPAIESIVKSDRTAPANQLAHIDQIREIKESNALDVVEISGFSDEELRSCFYSSPIDEKISERLNNMGYTGQIPLEDLRYVRVLYRDFDGRTVIGELIVNAEIASRIENVFYDLYTHKYEIAKMILPDAYGTNISEAFADNNTIALCFGLGEENRGSVHEKGYAVDLNPLLNPLIRDNGSSLSVFPMEGQLYLDRTVHAAHYIYAQDYAVSAFSKEGFIWKGDTAGLNDYKHFEYGDIPSPAPAQNEQPQEEASAPETQEQPSVQPEIPAEQPVEPVQDYGWQQPVQDEAAQEIPVDEYDRTYEEVPTDPVYADPEEGLYTDGAWQ